LLSNLGNI